jgi:hypothetical protein
MSETDREPDSGYLVDIPAVWFIGLLMAGGAILGFSVEGVNFGSETIITAWMMALFALVAFVFPWLN